jgi:hypothetical protein
MRRDGGKYIDYRRAGWGFLVAECRVRGASTTVSVDMPDAEAW